MRPRGRGAPINTREPTTTRRIGIVGGGQLGRMLGIAAKQLGFTVAVVDPNPNSPAGQVVDRQILGHYTDPAAIRALADISDVLTVEIEHIDVAALAEAEARVPVHPSPATLRLIQDKFAQKAFLRDAGVPVADFAPIDRAADLAEAARAFGFPLLLKSRFGAYDGRGNALIRNEAEIDAGLAKLGGANLYCERFVPFVKELAVVGARGAAGEIELYEPVETVHRNNICHETIAPAPIAAEVAEKATSLARIAVDQLRGAGVFAVELFLTESGEVVVNEIAPRVHNSGHWTIEGAETSQFEQQIRAVTGLPLGSTARVQPAAMVNLLGDRSGPVNLTGLAAALAVPNAHVHIYGKAETRPERKMGHLTATAETADLALERARQAAARISF